MRPAQITFTAPTRLPTPMYTPLPTWTPYEQAQAYCKAYGTFRKQIDAEAYRTQGPSINLFLWELQAGYGDDFESYCANANPPPLREFFVQIRPETRFGVFEDADLGSNATACLDFYYDIHGVLLVTLSSITQEKTWLPTFLNAVSRIDFGGVQSGQLISASMGQICPSIIESAQPQ